MPLSPSGPPQRRAGWAQRRYRWLGGGCHTRVAQQRVGPDAYPAVVGIGGTALQVYSGNGRFQVDACRPRPRPAKVWVCHCFGTVRRRTLARPQWQCCCCPLREARGRLACRARAQHADGPLAWPAEQVIERRLSEEGVAVGDCYCASHKNWTSVHQLPLQNHCFIGSGGGS